LFIFSKAALLIVSKGAVVVVVKDHLILKKTPTILKEKVIILIFEKTGVNDPFYGPRKSYPCVPLKSVLDCKNTPFPSKHT